MNALAILRRLFTLLTALAALAVSGAALADPPARVVRLAYTHGQVSLSPAGDNQWYQAQVNRPLAIGDRLWAAPGATAEVQMGGAVARIGTESDVSVLDFDDRIAQFQLSQGTLRLRVRRVDPGQVYEISTPNLAFTVIHPGEYRVDVDPADGSTLVMVRRGQAEVDGEGNAYTILAGRVYRFYGTGLRQYTELAMPAADELEVWARERDQAAERAAAAAYVSHDVVGYEDLDAWGRWGTDPTYGSIWYPTSVNVGWSPYVFGHWAWIAPWGWTWIDDAPWGFAVTHYGRWAHLRGRWGWIPGPARAHAVYSPALVVFAGGSNFRLSATFGAAPGIAWYPLGPREIYRPPYRVSRNYFTNVNVTNTYVTHDHVSGVYDRRDRDDTRHVNRSVAGAIVAMPATAFARSQPVQQGAARLRNEDLARAQVTASPDVAPARSGVRPDARAGSAPPARSGERPVIARNQPPAPVVGIQPAQTAPAAATSPRGRIAEPVQPQFRRAEAPQVRIVGPQPSAQQPRVAPERGAPADARGNEAQRAAPRTGPADASPTRPEAEPRQQPAVPTVIEQQQRTPAQVPGVDRGAREVPQPSDRGREQPARIDRSTPRVEPVQPVQPVQPRVEQPQPRIEQTQPRFEQRQPRIEQPQPRGEQPQPRMEQPQPRFEQPQPRIEQTQPRFEQRQPRFEQPQPRIEQPQPRIEQPQPRIETPQPRNEQSQPRFEQRPPRFEQPQPQPRIEQPQPRIEQPQPRFEQPQPRIEQSQPRFEQRQPRIEQPQPRVEQPQPRIEQPQPRFEQRQQRIEQPPPRIEAPQPRFEQRPPVQPPPPRIEQPQPRIEQAPRRIEQPQPQRQPRDPNEGPRRDCVPAVPGPVDLPAIGTGDGRCRIA